MPNAAPPDPSVRPLGPPLWLAQLETAIRIGDEAAFRQSLPRHAPHTLSRWVFRDVSPLRAAVEAGRTAWGHAVLAVSCEQEKTQVLVDLFSPERHESNELYRAIWDSTDKGQLLQTAITVSLDERLLEKLLIQASRLPGNVYDHACRVAVDQRRPAALETLIRWSRRQPDNALVEYAMLSHDPALQRAVIKRVSDFELGTAVATAADTGDLGALGELAAEMEDRGLSSKRCARNFSQALWSAIERADEPLWHWALPRAEMDHNKGRALRDALARRCVPWAEALIERGASPQVAFRALKDANRWDDICLLAQLVTPKQRASWLRAHPVPLASVRAWEREQQALVKPIPAASRLRLRT